MKHKQTKQRNSDVDVCCDVGWESDDDDGDGGEGDGDGDDKEGQGTENDEKGKYFGNCYCYGKKILLKYCFAWLISTTL